ncbi:hypothetical protein [uncultured Adlercreutzia sp.]|uniref:hypothetical protein n=1 Tax=uncultured Adlercreutzia sp. TaxID=875803 RepID=UPI00272DF9DE|nr:hypothetical protein [uncultured Adlercreutzia sp.]
MNRFAEEDTRITLEHAHQDQRAEAIPVSDWAIIPDHWYTAYVLFNLEAAFDEGHAILALGPVGGPLETYSFYRQGNAVKAPALMAQLEKPVPFSAIQKASGWIQHGQPGNYWNEHVDAALALAMPQGTYEPIRAFADAKAKQPGTYDLFTYNCLHFVEDALAAGDVHIDTHSGRALHTIIPKDAFKDARTVSGDHAERYQTWKYWFPLAPEPKNGLRSIPDAL